MDPRIRRRRVDVQRTEGRRRLRTLLSASAVVCVAFGAVAATRSPLLDVDYVDVQGAEHTARADLLRATGLDRHPQMVDVRAGEVARRAATVPWVASVEVEKAWPQTVRIRVVERIAVAIAPAPGGGIVLLDRSGRVLERRPDAPPNVIAVTPSPIAVRPGRTIDGAARDALAVAAAVPVHLQDRVREATPTAGGEVELKLAPRGVVRVGPPQQLAAKVRTLETMMAKVDLRRLAVLDIRAPSAPVLTRQ
jgi:cell division protein FtsQ